MDPTDAKQQCRHFVTEQLISRALARTEPAGDVIGPCPQCGEILTVSFRVTRVSPTTEADSAEATPEREALR
jgi:hypothetical protein